MPKKNVLEAVKEVIRSRQNFTVNSQPMNLKGVQSHLIKLGFKTKGRSVRYSKEHFCFVKVHFKIVYLLSFFQAKTKNTFAKSRSGCTNINQWKGRLGFCGKSHTCMLKSRQTTVYLNGRKSNWPVSNGQLDSSKEMA